MDELKLKLYQHCMDFVMQRIDTAETSLKQSQEASNDDTKSSAGDKFETTREMVSQDISRTKGLLADAKQSLQQLLALENMAGTGDAVRNGSLVHTSKGTFYISISAGQIKVGEQQVFAISFASPIGKLMIGKKVGESFSFNQNAYTINQIQ